MRSRSTVLSHILGSNEEICGYRELHRNYRMPIDLIKLKLDLYGDFQDRIEGKRLLDKILHNSNKISFSILKSENMQVIFLLREPDSTLKSIMKMGIRNRNKDYADAHYVTKYYCDRLEKLKKYAFQLNGNFFFIESDKLVTEGGRILKDLSSWLDLKNDLDSHYKTFGRTGQAGAGDPSTNIKAGTLIKTEGHSDIDISQELLQQAKKSYDVCKAELQRLQSLK